MSKRQRKVAGRFSTITSCISTTMVLILLGIVVFFVLVANNFSTAVRQNFTLEVLVSDSTTHHELYTLQSYLKKQKYTLRTNYISKDKSSSEIAKSDKNFSPDGFLDYNPLPQEFEVFLKADYVNTDSLTKFIPAIRKQKGVTDVIYPQDELKELDNIIPTASIILLSIAALLAFVSFALINNTIRLTIYSKRFEIHTMKLVGASWRFIRKPFLLNALLVGLIAGIFASAFIGTGIYYSIIQNNFFSQLITPFVIAITISSMFICGIILTLFCAYVSVNRYLKMSENELHLH